MSQSVARRATLARDVAAVPVPSPPPGQSERIASRIGAVIVTYFPGEAGLRALLHTPGGSRSADLVDPQERIQTPRNLGLAAAQNIGIERLRELGCDFVVLLDQDSLPTEHMVENLYRAWARGSSEGIRIGAVGPQWVDRLTGTVAPFVRLGIGRMRKLRCRDGDLVPCDLLISSGSLIPMAVLDDVGLMDSGLFIDHVDHDWGLRAQTRGWKLYGTGGVRLQHGIGENRIRLWFFGWRELPVHAPLRDYYKVRNAIAVFLLRPSAWRWRLFCAVMLPTFALVSLLLLPRRRQRAAMMLRGVRDALARRVGPLE
jgi:rhamnosyltransferase